MTTINLTIQFRNQLTPQEISRAAIKLVKLAGKLDGELVEAYLLVTGKKLSVVSK